MKILLVNRALYAAAAPSLPGGTADQELFFHALVAGLNIQASLGYEKSAKK